MLEKSALNWTPSEKCRAVCLSIVQPAKFAALSPGCELQKAEQIQRNFWSSFLLCAVVMLCGMGLAFVFGKIALNLAPDLGKIVSVFGAFLAAWGTVFQLQRPPESWSCETSPEIVCLLLFRCLFGAGLLFATFGQVWWQ